MARKQSRIDWNLEGFEELRKDPKVQDYVNKLAEEIVEIASENGRVEGYVVAPRVLQEERSATSIIAFGHANNHNFKHNALPKAMYQVKGNNG